MTDIDSDDYHDFVFHGGKLIGEFEQMYAKSKEIPWHQDQDSKRIDCKIALSMVDSCIHKGASIAEIGCGLGYFAHLLYERIESASITGFDISETAVDTARLNFPHIKFEQMDITLDLPLMEKYDLVCIRGCFWYLFPKLDKVIQNLCALVKPGALILIAQNFPPLDKPFVGKDVIPSPDALLQRFSPTFETVLECRLDDRTSPGGNDNWIIYIGRRIIQ